MIRPYSKTWPLLLLLAWACGADRPPIPADDVAAARTLLTEEREAVLADELRSFVVACSRARRSLLVTAVDDADHQPSPFLDLVDPADDEVDPRRTAVPAPLDLRGLVAQLRAHLEPLVAHWWLPDALEIIDEVPKTSVGKFSKRTLREKFAGYKFPE